MVSTVGVFVQAVFCEVIMYRLRWAFIGKVTESCRVRRLSTYRTAEPCISYLSFPITVTPVILRMVNDHPYGRRYLLRGE